MQGRALWVALLLGTGAIATPAIAQSDNPIPQIVPADAPTYTQFGRNIGMGGGGPKIHFPYINVNFPMMQSAAIETTQLTLAAIADPAAPMGAALSAEQRAIIAAIRVRPTQTPMTGFRAVHNNTGRWIEIPAEAAYYQVTMAGTMYDVGRTDNLGYMNLFVMSEVDYWSRTSPRWYQSNIYSDWIGAPRWDDSVASDPRFVGLIWLINGGMVLHEICHHLRGHVDPAMMARFAALDPVGKRNLSIANEMEADACATELGAKGGLLPDLSLALNLAGSIVMGDRPSNTHPTSAQRFAAAKLLRNDALNAILTHPENEQLDMTEDDYSTAMDELWASLERWQDLYAPE